MPALPSHFTEQEAGHTDKINTCFLQGHTFREPVWAANPGLLDPQMQLPLSGCGLRRKDFWFRGMTRQQPEGVCSHLEPRGQKQGERLSWTLQRQYLLRVTDGEQESSETALLCDSVGLTSVVALRPGRWLLFKCCPAAEPGSGFCLRTQGRRSKACSAPSHGSRVWVHPGLRSWSGRCSSSSRSWARTSWVGPGCVASAMLCDYVSPAANKLLPLFSSAFRRLWGGWDRDEEG